MSRSLRSPNAPEMGLLLARLLVVWVRDVDAEPLQVASTTRSDAYDSSVAWLVAIVFVPILFVIVAVAVVFKATTVIVKVVAVCALAFAALLNALIAPRRPALPR